MPETSAPEPEKEMDRDLDLARVVHETIRRYPGTLEELGDSLGGVAPGTLSRWGCPHDENSSPREMPLARAIPLQKATGNPSILRHMARRLGFDVVCAGGRARARSQADLPAFWTATGQAADLLAQAYAAPADPKKQTDARDALTRLIEEAASHRKAVERGLAQEELNL